MKINNVIRKLLKEQISNVKQQLAIEKLLESKKRALMKRKLNQSVQNNKFEISVHCNTQIQVNEFPCKIDIKETPSQEQIQAVVKIDIDLSQLTDFIDNQIQNFKSNLLNQLPDQIIDNVQQCLKEQVRQLQKKNPDFDYYNIEYIDSKEVNNLYRAIKDQESSFIITMQQTIQKID